VQSAVSRPKMWKRFPAPLSDHPLRPRIDGGVTLVIRNTSARRAS
jgi:hypothetical protein